MVQQENNKSRSTKGNSNEGVIAERSLLANAG